VKNRTHRAPQKARSNDRISRAAADLLQILDTSGATETLPAADRQRVADIRDLVEDGGER
jgi:hypothetical protein